MFTKSQKKIIELLKTGKTISVFYRFSSNIPRDIYLDYEDSKQKVRKDTFRILNLGNLIKMVSEEKTLGGGRQTYVLSEKANGLSEDK